MKTIAMNIESGRVWAPKECDEVILCTAANGAYWGYNKDGYFVCESHEEPKDATAAVTPSRDLAELWFRRDYA